MCLDNFLNSIDNQHLTRHVPYKVIQTATANADQIIYVERVIDLLNWVTLIMAQDT